jgi:hypothetical protein
MTTALRLFFQYRSTHGTVPVARRVRKAAVRTNYRKPGTAHPAEPGFTDIFKFAIRALH